MKLTKTALLGAISSIVVTPALAGTLTIDWRGSSQHLNPVSEVCSYGENDENGCAGTPWVEDPFSAQYVFDVSIVDGASFSFSGVLQDGVEEVVSNPLAAVLVSGGEDDYNEEGYFNGSYEVSVDGTGVSVNATYDNDNDWLYLSLNSITDDRNAGTVTYDSRGRWVASYVPSGPNDGAAFTVAPVPLPASLPILGGALMMIGAAGKRRRNRRAA